MLNKTQNRTLSIFLIFYTLIILDMFFDKILEGHSMNDYLITEWIINYQGGFVRRGLPGEILYQLYSCLGVNPYSAIIGFSVFIQIAIIAIFVRLFVKKGYPLLLLPLTIFLGNAIINDFWARKDNLTILLILGLFYAFSAVKRKWLKYILVNFIFVLGILIHEVIFFVGMPMLLTLIVSEIKGGSNELKLKTLILSIPQACIYVLPTLGAFCLVMVYSGNSMVAEDIINSWDVGVFPNPPIMELKWGAILGLTWSSYFNFAYTMHHYLVLGKDILPFISVVVVLFVIYYILSNAEKMSFKLFKYTPRSFNGDIVRYVLLFQTLFVMFPLLLTGCDTGRWIYLWVCSTFGILCIVPESILQAALPNQWIRITELVNNRLTSLLGQSRGLVLFLAVATGFNVIFAATYWASDIFTYSPLYLVLKTISFIANFIIK